MVVRIGGEVERLAVALRIAQDDRAARDPRRLRQDAEDRLRDHGLARAALADQGDGLAALDRERDAAHRLDQALVGQKIDREILHLEQRTAHAATPAASRVADAEAAPEQVGRTAQHRARMRRKHPQQPVEKRPAGLVHRQMVAEDADRLVGIEHRHQALECRDLADEQPLAAPVDRIEMGVDLHEARRGFGRGAPAVGREPGEAAGGEAPDQSRIETVPGRHQHREERGAEGIDQDLAAARQFGLDRRDRTAAELAGLLARGCMVAVREAVLQHARLGACGDPRLRARIEPDRHDRERQRQGAPLGQLEQALEARIAAAGVVVAPPQADRLAFASDGVERRLQLAPAAHLGPDPGVPGGIAVSWVRRASAATRRAVVAAPSRFQVATRGAGPTFAGRR